MKDVAHAGAFMRLSNAPRAVSTLMSTPVVALEKTCVDMSVDTARKIACATFR